MPALRYNGNPPLATEWLAAAPDDGNIAPATGTTTGTAQGGGAAGSWNATFQGPAARDHGDDINSEA